MQKEGRDLLAGRGLAHDVVDGLLGGGLLIFIQCVELLYDLGVFQFDDLAGEVVEGIFLGNVERLPYLISPSTGLPR